MNIILGILISIAGILLLIYSRKISDKLFKIPAWQGLSTGKFWVLGIFMFLAGLALIFLALL